MQVEKEKETRLERKLQTKDVTTIVKEFMVKVGLDEEFEITIKRRDHSKFLPFNKKVIYIKPIEKETQLVIGTVYYPTEASADEYMIEVDGVTSSYPIESFELHDGRKKYTQPNIDNLEYTLTDNTYFVKLDKASESIYILTDSIRKTYQEYNKEGYSMDILNTFKYEMENHSWYAITNSYKIKILQGVPKIDNTIFGTIQKLANENKIIVK